MRNKGRNEFSILQVTRSVKKITEFIFFYSPMQLTEHLSLSPSRYSLLRFTHSFQWCFYFAKRSRNVSFRMSCKVVEEFVFMPSTMSNRCPFSTSGIKKNRKVPDLGSRAAIWFFDTKLAKWQAWVRNEPCVTSPRSGILLRTAKRLYGIHGGENLKGTVPME